MVTDNTEASNKRPRMTEKNPLMSSSSRPTRKKNEYAYAQDNLDLGTRLHQPGYGAKDDPGCGVGDNGIEAESFENTFQQLGYDNQQTNRKEGFVEFQSEVGSLVASTRWRR